MGLFKRLIFLPCTQAQINTIRRNISLLNIVAIAADHLNLVHVLVADKIPELPKFSEVLVIPLLQVVFYPRFQPVEEGVEAHLMLKREQIRDVGECSLVRIQLSEVFLHLAQLLRDTAHVFFQVDPSLLPLV